MKSGGSVHIKTPTKRKKETKLLNLGRSLAGLHNFWQPGSWAVRKWRENEEIERKWRENEGMERKWRENEEMERDSLSALSNFLFTSSLSIHFLYQKLSYFVAKC